MSERAEDKIGLLSVPTAAPKTGWFVTADARPLGEAEATPPEEVTQVAKQRIRGWRERQGGGGPELASWEVSTSLQLLLSPISPSLSHTWKKDLVPTSELPEGVGSMSRLNGDLAVLQGPSVLKNPWRSHLWGPNQGSHPVSCAAPF